MQKVTPEQVLKYIQGSKKSIQDVASKFDVGTGTARKHIINLYNQGKLAKSGTRPQPNQGLGRPSDLYEVKA